MPPRSGLADPGKTRTRVTFSTKQERLSMNFVGKMDPQTYAGWSRAARSRLSASNFARASSVEMSSLQP